jgi:protease I
MRDKTMAPLSGKKVAIFVGDAYEDMELQYPKYRLLEAGAEVVVAGLESGKTYYGKHGYPQKSQATVDELKPEHFDALVVPGGWMPDKLRRYDSVKNFTAAIHEAGKCVASICHGPWIDISAGIVDGATYASTPAIKDDLINAGAKWVDQPLCVDGNHVTSRRPDDLPQFMQGMFQVMGVAEAVA